MAPLTSWTNSRSCITGTSRRCRLPPMVIIIWVIGVNTSRPASDRSWMARVLEFLRFKSRITNHCFSVGFMRRVLTYGQFFKSCPRQDLPEHQADTCFRRKERDFYSRLVRLSKMLLFYSGNSEPETSVSPEETDI